MTTTYTFERQTDTVDIAGTPSKFVDTITETWEDADVAAKRSLDLPAPVYVTGPGIYAEDSTGSLLSLSATGAVYRDARQMWFKAPTATIPGIPIVASCFVVVGRAIYAKGKTNPQWWQWTGTGWTVVTDGDPNILNGTYIR